jgi:hypothetical protein
MERLRVGVRERVQDKCRLTDRSDLGSFALWGDARRHRGLPREVVLIRKLKSGGYRLYSRKADPQTGKRRTLGTFASREAAEKHEREVQYFKRH